MKIVIEMVDDGLQPLSAEAGTELLKRMLAESRGVSQGGSEMVPLDGHLELADFEGRAVIVKIAGVALETYARSGYYNVIPLADA